MASTQALSHVYPLGTRINDAGHIEVGGCDLLDVAERFGTPAYVVAEDDLRARARAFVTAFEAAGHTDFRVIFASKTFPATAVMGVFAQEGLGCDVASAGEQHLALAAGFAPRDLVLHGNARDDQEFELALRAGVGLIVLDNFDDIARLARLASGPQPVLLRVTPDVRGETHDKISTGQADSKFGLGLDDVREAIRQLERIPLLDLRGIHFHIGSNIRELTPFRDAIAAVADLGDFPVYDLGGGLGVPYLACEAAPSIEDYVGEIVAAAHELLGPDKRLLIEPGRALVANGTVTIYRVVSMKQNVSTWVAVDGGMSDNLRPMLYGARYEADIADRPGGETRVRLTGKHCESGDVLIDDALLDEPRVGDLIVVPVTGAYGHAMANNYNGVPRPPVIFCRDGEARAVVRRESFDDLTARDL
jgi:diaminopimelate decarboxylase